MSDLVYQGSRLYYKTFCDSNPFEANAKRPFNRSGASYAFVCFVGGQGFAEGLDPLASSSRTTLQLVEALLDATEGSKWTDGTHGHEVTLLSKLLLALPYLVEGKTAITGCRIATRLAQSWSLYFADMSTSEDVVRAVDIVVDVFARLDRAHSWLRTVSVANWTGSAILPPQVQVRKHPPSFVALDASGRSCDRRLCASGVDGVTAGVKTHTAPSWCVAHHRNRTPNHLQRCHVPSRPRRSETVFHRQCIPPYNPAFHGNHPAYGVIVSKERSVGSTHQKCLWLYSRRIKGCCPAEPCRRCLFALWKMVLRSGGGCSR
jgi:hypothetical protein